MMRLFTIFLVLSLIRFGRSDIDDLEVDGDGIEEHVLDQVTAPGVVGKRVNYASLNAGAVVLGSNPEMKGSANVLKSDRDKYALSPCEARKWVVIGLSDDVRVFFLVYSQI